MTVYDVKDMRNAIDKQIDSLKQIAQSATDYKVIEEVRIALDWIKDEANHAKFELKNALPKSEFTNHNS